MAWWNRCDTTQELYSRILLELESKIDKIDRRLNVLGEMQAFAYEDCLIALNHAQREWTVFRNGEVVASLPAFWSRGDVSTWVAGYLLGRITYLVISKERRPRILKIII